MTKVRVNAYSISVDGFGAGPDQSLEHPLGRGAEALHEWFIPTEAFRTLFGKTGGTTGINNIYAKAATDNLGAWILGRNMFAHSRGPWTDDGWKGWWGDVPPYHCDVFILTHFAREPLVMADTTFHFVTGGIHEALERARTAAKGKDIRIGGGAETIRQYLAARLIDHMHIAQSPVLLGRGESPFAGIDLPELGYAVTKAERSEDATHLTITRKA